MVTGQEIEDIKDASSTIIESVKSKTETITTIEESKPNQNTDQKTDDNTSENIEYNPSYYEVYDLPINLPSAI
jgi:hypothetical protein